MRHRLFILGLLLSLAAPLLAQRASIRAGKTTFRTYGFGDPDPVARMNKIYPYFRFDGFSVASEDRVWTVVEMENPYIRVLVCPEQGGKVLGAFDRETGRDFIYFNQVMKFRDVAMRGPWTSGGIEFNFGAIGHAPTTATPVDYRLRENEDGSVSCFVGAMDLASRTRWQVEIRLPADRAWFETRSHWENPTPYQSSLYHWMNGAVTAASNLRYVYPGNAFIGHGGKPSPWPVDAAGRDLSLYGNNNFGSYKSYHVLGQHTDFFGGIYEGEGFGFGHWADYGSKPGKKIWIWGLSRQGMIWEDLLTDTDLGNRQYSEIQSGLLFNQAGGGSSRTPFKHRFFKPGEALDFREIWFPVRHLEGMSDANDHAVLHVETTSAQMVIGVSALSPLEDVLRVFSGGRLLAEQPVVLSPLAVFRDTIECNGHKDITVSLVGAGLSFQSDQAKQKSLSRPLTLPADFDAQSAYGLYLSAVELARQRDWPGALHIVQESLKAQPCFVPALNLKAECHLKHLDPEQAFDAAKKALAVDAYDGRANYLYGLAARQLHRSADALDGLGIASAQPQTAVPAMLQLAEMAGAEGNWRRVLLLSEAMLQASPRLLKAMQYRAVALRKLGRNQWAQTELSRITDLHPLSPFVACECYLVEGRQGRRKAFQRHIGGELPHETFLELALFYHRMGLVAEAKLVLDASPDHPVVLLWRAYCASQIASPNESLAYLEKAMAGSPHLVFPHRFETLAPLNWALLQRDSWKFRYYLGLILWQHHRLDAARAQLRACRMTPDDAPFYLSRAKFLEGLDERAVLKDLKQALRLDSQSWRSHAAMLDWHLKHDHGREAVAAAQTARMHFPEDYRMLLRCARAWMAGGNYAEVIDILQNLTILPYEGAQDGRRLYRAAHVMAAVEQLQAAAPDSALTLVNRARTWPERLGVGRPYTPDERVEDFVAAHCLEALGREDEAEACWLRIVSYSDSVATGRDSRSLITALALRALGREAAGASLLEAWNLSAAESRMAQWAEHFYSTGRSAMENRAQSEARRTPWEAEKGDADAALVRLVVEALMEKE